MSIHNLKNLWYNSISQNLDLSFTGFLIEMETTTQEKELIREIIQRIIKNDKSWLSDHFILVGDKGSYWILNYLQGPRNEYNRLVRGMVVKKPDPNWSGDELELIRSFPFTRFFNHGEPDAAPVDLANAEMLEKLDGTMVGVFFPENNPSIPHFHTRKMSSVHDPDMDRTITSFYGKEFKFLPTIKGYVDKLKFTNVDVEYTYVFEFLHESSYVLTKYTPDKYGLYMLGARNIKNHKELTEDELDAVAKRVGAKRPRRFDTVADLSTIEKMFDLAAAEIPDFEGYVFRDKKTGQRIKVKDPKYVKKHHLLDDTSYKALIPKILEGEEEEVIAYFPHVKGRIEDIKKAYSKYLNKVIDKVLEWKEKGLTGRELSVKLFGENPLAKWELRLKKLRGEAGQAQKSVEPDEFIRSMILKFSSSDEETIRVRVDEELKKIGLGQGNNLGDPKRLIDMIGLNEPEEQKSDVGEI